MMNYLREKLSPYAPPSPEWVIVAGLVALYSFLLLMLALLAGDDNKLVALTQQYFLVYDFGTTALWFCQTALNTATTPRDSQISWSLWIEWILSAVFLCMSAHTVYLWKFTDEDITGSSLDAFLNLAAYSWAADAWNRTLQERQPYLDINLHADSDYRVAS